MDRKDLNAGMCNLDHVTVDLVLHDIKVHRRK